MGKIISWFSNFKINFNTSFKEYFYLQLLQNIGFIPCITQCTPEPTLYLIVCTPHPYIIPAPSLCPLAITNFFPVSMILLLLL